MSARRIGVAAGLGGLAVGVLALGTLRLGSLPEERTAAASEPQAASPALECRFRSGQTAAFTFESRATLDAETSRPAEDHFRGLLSWIVLEEAQGGRPALLRASLRSLVLDQALSEERASAEELVDSPFFVQVDSTCRFTGLGFSPRWSAASRRLVTTLLDGFEVVLPGDDSTRWEAEQRDGVGAYTAEYSASSSTGPRTIVRSKPGYRLDDEARRMGIRVQLLGARAEARFDPERPGWVEHLEGRETVRFHIPGEDPQGFVHRFRVTRDDDRFVAVADSLSLEEADFTDALTADRRSPPPMDPALAALDHPEARSRFLALLRDGGRGAIYPAARFLAGWLRAHPDESALLLADLRSGAIDEAAHSSLFLALELAGTDESRQVLTDAVVDEQLSELDRARAASALADHGEPSRSAADLLLAQARESASPMVANVSLLGVGSMAGRTRADDPLRAELRDALRGELDRASGDPGEIAVVDALGNSGDDAFGPALDERLREGRPSLRAHAADALGHLSPEVARPLLVAQLEEETSPGVSAAILRSLSRMEPTAELDLTLAELSLAARKLATSPSVEERGAVIEWVGRARQQLEARQVLAAHFHQEPSVHLQQRIGAFVSSSDLRELVR